MAFTLSLTPLATSTLPTASDALSAGKAIIDAVPTWKAGKQKNGVQSYSKKFGSETYGWHARVSQHPTSEVTFDDLWNALAVDHYTKEVQYIKHLKRVEKLVDTELGEAWALHYSFPPPVAPRVFTQILVIHLDDSDPSKRVGQIVQIPFDLAGSTDDAGLLEKQGKDVKGAYVSVEQIKEEDGQLEWRMATCSTPGGSIPAWISERSIPGEIILDVPAVLNWIKKHKTA